jgi:hypothetical protein
MCFQFLVEIKKIELVLESKGFSSAFHYKNNNEQRCLITLKKIMSA